MSEWNEKVIDEFRANHGRVQGFGRALILLHHVGARTGTPRTSPVMAIHPDDDTWLIAASMGGAPTHPGWFHNLRAQPDVTIETPEATVAVHAEVLAPDERDAAWALFTQRSDGFRKYQERTERVIPVVRLTRRTDDGTESDAAG